MPTLSTTFVAEMSSLISAISFDESNPTQGAICWRFYPDWKSYDRGTDAAVKSQPRSLFDPG